MAFTNRKRRSETVIYTRALPANFAVVWSGMFNLLGVLASFGAVAFGIISLLPVELILQVGGSAGFAMVFALLIAAIIWNLGTWAFRAAGIELAHAGGLHNRRRRDQTLFTAVAGPRALIGRRQRRLVRRCWSLPCLVLRSLLSCC